MSPAELRDLMKMHVRTQVPLAADPPVKTTHHPVLAEGKHPIRELVIHASGFARPWREEAAVTELHGLTSSDLRRRVRYLSWQCDGFHRTARWLLAICGIEAVVVVCLALS